MSTAPTDRVFLGLGSNLGDRRRHLETAVAMLQAAAGLEVVRVSPWVETDPVGGPPQGQFLNGALELNCALAPHELLAKLQAIEAALGRERTVRWGPRPIDLDILLFGQRVIGEPDLVVPHPRLLERSFVLEPLARIAADVVHPQTGQTIAQHLAALLRAGVPHDGAVSTGTP